MKYNWSIIGHEKQLLSLENDISNGNIAHAYLLAGPHSIGKATVARKLAGILQCENDYCHTCPTCVQVGKGSHIDTVEFLDNGESIKIEEIRNLVERINMTRQSKYKVIVIQAIERMTVEAANSFLKSLEEPPENTVFIITSNNIREVLPTIISRVRVLKFALVSSHYLEKKLEELYMGMDREELKKISLFSLGKTGKAIELAENHELLTDYTKIYHDIQNFCEHKSIVDRFSYVDALLQEEGYGVDLFLEMLTSVLRTKLIASPSEKLIKTLSKIEEAGILLKKNVNAKLVLENLMLTI